MSEESDKMGLKKQLFGKISRKIIFVFLVIALIVGVFGFISINESQEALKRNIGRTSVMLAKESLDKIDRGIYNRIEEMQVYSKDLILQNAIVESNKEFSDMNNIQGYIDEKDREWTAAGEKEITPFMQEIMDNRLSDELREKVEFYEEKYGYNVYDKIIVTNKFGAVSGQTAKSADYRQDDKEWWQNVKRNGMCVEDIKFDESTGIYSVSICIRIEDEAGNFMGVIKAVLNIDEVIRIVKELAENEEQIGHGYEEQAASGIKLLTGDGRVIYSTEEFEVLEDVSEELISRFYLVTSPEHVQYFIGPSDLPGEGEEMFSHSHSDGYREFKGLDWILVIEHKTEEMFTAIGELENTILIIIAITLGFTVLIGLFASKLISKPIEKLQKATEEIEKGNFDIRLDIKTGDELEKLGNAFNRSAGALEKMDKDRKQLEHAKTEFLSITSHELRSPMTPMKAQLQMLEKGYFGKLNEKQKAAIDIVLQNTNRLDNIVIDFLEISRIETARLKFRFVKANLAENTKKLVKEMTGYIPEKKCEIIVRVEKLPAIKVDPDRVMQVLRNLISNAKKFSFANCKIVVSAELKDNWIQFSVKDNGIGIAKENQTKVFEPFFQEEQTMYRKYGGTGLGLTICKGIVEAQGGRIWLESELGKGSTFYFTVPLKPAKEIKPIKVLFSSQKNAEKKIEMIFNEMLGPIGSKEFAQIKKQGIVKENIAKYIELLKSKKIIGKEKGEEFKRKTMLVLNEQNKKAGAKK